MLDRAIRVQEAIVDAGAQTVLVDRIAEVPVRVPVFGKKRVAVMPSRTAGAKYSKMGARRLCRVVHLDEQSSNRSRSC